MPEADRVAGTRPDNRAAWVRALYVARGTDAAETLKPLLPVLSLLFCLQIGTGSVERGLGAHSKFRKAHGGGVGGEVSWAEVCFEIWADGPKAELDLAVPAEPRDSCPAESRILLTDFSRRCATLWLAKHGRRFSCYKERKDKGVRTHLRYKGSLAAVKAGQRQAFDALTAMRAADVAAKRETRIVFGKQWSRTAIVDAAEARASSAEAGKEMRNFAERTAAIHERKR